MKLLGSTNPTCARIAIAALSAAAAAVFPLSAQTSLTGAGATFPGPYLPEMVRILSIHRQHSD